MDANTLTEYFSSRDGGYSVQPLSFTPASVVALKREYKVSDFGLINFPRELARIVLLEHSHTDDDLRCFEAHEHAVAMRALELLSVRSHMVFYTYEHSTLVAAAGMERHPDLVRELEDSEADDAFMLALRRWTDVCGWSAVIAGDESHLLCVISDRRRHLADHDS